VHVLGTAGHVDHGKSTLIERLTGIDPDRLAEEKARGLTIDLGFAWFTLPSGREAGIVDVPGHERFVHNMLAGAGQIDAAIFVVAATEGWKPQSEEHLAILDLLGAGGGVVALTKRDLVSGEELARVRADVGKRVAGTMLEGAAMVPVSAVTGDGMADLIASLDALLGRIPPSPDRGRPRLWVDRAFSIKGSGTVVTGTLTGGSLGVDDEVEVLPAGARSRVRSIETHKRRRDSAEPGSRVALNLAGLERAAIARGDAIVRPGQWRATDLLDVWIRPVRDIDHAIAARGTYTLHLGSAEVDVRLRLLDIRAIEPGGEALARLQLAAPLAAEPFDRFVLRDVGRSATVAGGRVLDPHPAVRRLSGREKEKRVAQLEARQRAAREELPALVVDERGALPADEIALLAGAELPPGPLRGYAVSPAWLSERTEALIGALAAFHAANSLSRGMPREDARAATGLTDARLFAALEDALGDRITSDGPLLSLASHRVTLTPEQEAVRLRVLADLDAAAYSPPTLTELSSAHGSSLIQALVDAGELVRVSRDFALTSERYAAAKAAIAEAARSEGPLTTSRIRELLGTSRKYAIPMLEHLDSVGFTKRSGDVRTVADGAG
jgi:selenocysteine-specific elongation factor